MSTKLLLSGLVFLALLGTSVAWWGGFGPWMSNVPEEVKEQFTQAMENKDFETMQALRDEYRPEINETAKGELDSLREQMHDAMVAGDYETADGLREQMRELAPGPGPGFGHGRMGGFGPGGFHGGDVRPEGAPSECNCPCMETDEE